MTDEALLEAVQLRQRYPTLQAAADAIGIARTTLQSRLTQAAARGLDGSVPHPLPLGQRVAGTSTLYDASGGTVLQWVKTTAERGTEDVIEAIRAAFDEYKGHAELPDPPVSTDSDLVTFYNIADHHLGLYAWAKETGDDYDLAIGERLLKTSVADLIATAPKSETAVILNLGDFFHADDTLNRTAQSGNPLDTDTRYAKVLQVGIELMMQCIDLTLQKHQNVIVRCLQGNHDPHTAIALSYALKAFYAANDRVTVDCGPSRFFKFRFGKVLVGATHGDELKPVDMPGFMASQWPQDWGETIFRYAYLGHVHHASKGGGEKNGVIWETFQSLVAKDAWHAGMGYTSGRSMSAITHHRDRGEWFRHTVSVR